MMRGSVALCAAALLCGGGDLHAQELSAFGAVASGRSYGYFGGGFSIARYIRSKGDRSGDSSSFREPAPALGLRLAASALVSTEPGPTLVACAPPGCGRPNRERVRLYPVQLTALVRPYTGRATRLDLGGGISYYALRFPGLNDGALGFVGTAGLSLRIIDRAWLMMNYDLSGEPYRSARDSSQGRPGRHILRMGLSWGSRDSS
jgi:hypothetical protein